MNKIKMLAQRSLSKIFPYRGYFIDWTPKFSEHNGTGGGYVKGARASHFLTASQTERAFSKNY
jgi:hypothetical protein